MKGKQLGLPYMGSKRKIASEIVDYIISKNPNVKYVYDLFGGGGAISMELLQRKQIKQVYYNEFNKGIYSLMKKIKEDGITEEFYKWITREDFFNLKDEDTWQGGLVKTCWSFGNKQDTYLFGKEIEDKKRLVHEIAVNKCKESIKDFEQLTGLLIDNNYLQSDNLHKRRVSITNLIKHQLGRFDMQQLELMQQLERMQQLLNLQSLEILNYSYEQVKIETPVEETILYCDPPYKGTGKYQCDINHDLFLEWCKNNKYKVYISSYDFDLPMVYQIGHKSTLSATNNCKSVAEKIFCNQEEKVFNLFDMVC